MYIIKNRGKHIFAIIKNTDTLNKFWSNLAPDIKKNMIIVFHYPPKFPFYLVEYIKEDQTKDYETFEKIDLPYLKKKYTKGTIFKVTKGYKNKDGETILTQLTQDFFNETTRELKIK